MPINFRAHGCHLPLPSSEALGPKNAGKHEKPKQKMPSSYWQHNMRPEVHSGLYYVAGAGAAPDPSKYK